MACRYRATFHPQQDRAAERGRGLASIDPAEPRGETSWDCTDYLTSQYSDAQRAELLQESVGSELTDSVRNDPAAPAWVGAWEGPFEVTVEVAL